MKNPLKIGTIAVLGSTSAVALGNDLVRVQDRLEETVVTSSRVPMPLRQIGTSVSLITKPEIEQMGLNSLFDVLRTQPGVAVNNQGGAGGITSVRIRGEESYRTRFYLDGIDISDTSSPQVSPRVEQILSTGVERVEILRGPQGLMYGADAGGVVNITTVAAGDGLNGSVSAETGRYDSQQYAANLNGGNDTVDFSLSAANYASDQFNARTTDIDLMDDDGYENTTLHGRFGWNVSDALRLSGVLRDVKADTDYDGCFTVSDFAPSNACNDEFDQRAWRIAANYTQAQFSHEFFYTNNDISRDNFTQDELAFTLAGELERTGYLGSFSNSEAMQLVYGVDLLTETLDDSSAQERDQIGYYAEYQGEVTDQLFLTAGVRHDDNDDFGSTTTYRFSGAYLIPMDDGEVKLRATYGTGLRAPSLFEIGNNGFAFVAPPELTQEETAGYDLALSWTDGSAIYAELVYFNQQIDDEIFFDDTDFVYLQKSGETQSEGIEFYTRWDITSSIALDANYTFTDSQDIDGQPRARRPEHVSNIGLRWRTLGERLTLGLQGRLSRDSVDIDGTALDDYEVLDINASFAVSEGLELFGRIENATDEDYEEVPTYNVSGAAGHVGLRYAF